MSKSKSDFFAKLKEEIYIIKEDIDSLIEYENALHSNNTHGNYVFLENLVVLKDEIMGLEGVLGIIHQLEESNLDSTKDIPEQVMERISNFIISRGYPMAIDLMIKRKIEKINKE